MWTVIVIAVVVLIVVLGEWIGGPLALFNNPATKRVFRTWSNIRRRD
jgi:hypothetical protein